MNSAVHKGAESRACQRVAIIKFVYAFFAEVANICIRVIYWQLFHSFLINKLAMYARAHYLYSALKSAWVIMLIIMIGWIIKISTGSKTMEC